MNLTKKERKIKYLLYALLILASALLQNVFGTRLEIGGARCFFMIPTAVALGIDEDERMSAIIGCLAGFLWDMLSSQHFGFNFAFLMLVCYVTSALVSYLLRATYWVTLSATILASGLYSFLYWLFFVAIGGGDGSVASLGYFYIPCFVYTAFVSFLIVAILRPIKRKINRQPIMD